MVLAVSIPSRFGFAKTLVLVATIILSQKLRVPHHFPHVSRSLMEVVSGVLSCVSWHRGCDMARRLARDSSLLLVHVALSSEHLRGITVAVILGLSTLWAVCPFLYLRVLSWETFSPTV